MNSMTRASMAKQTKTQVGGSRSRQIACTVNTETIETMTFSLSTLCFLVSTFHVALSAFWYLVSTVYTLRTEWKAGSRLAIVSRCRAEILETKDPNAIGQILLNVRHSSFQLSVRTIS